MYLMSYTLAKVGSVKLVKHLLSTGVSANVPDILGRRALHLCAQATREPPSSDPYARNFLNTSKAFSASVVVEMVELLVSSGADINAETRRREAVSWTAYSMCCHIVDCD